MTDLELSELDDRARELDAAHVFHSWSAQAGLKPLVIAGGSGSRVWDHAGRSWLDFSSQLVNTNIGHQHPAVVAAIQAQASVHTRTRRKRNAKASIDVSDIKKRARERALVTI